MAVHDLALRNWEASDAAKIRRRAFVLGAFFDMSEMFPLGAGRTLPLRLIASPRDRVLVKLPRGILHLFSEAFPCGVVRWGVKRVRRLMFAKT